MPIHYPLSGLTRAYQRKLRVPRLLHTGQPATSYLTRRLKEEEDLFPLLCRLVLQIWPAKGRGCRLSCLCYQLACKEPISLCTLTILQVPCLYSFIFSSLKPPVHSLSARPILSLSPARSPRFLLSIRPDPRTAGPGRRQTKRTRAALSAALVRSRHYRGPFAHQVRGQVCKQGLSLSP